VLLNRRLRWLAREWLPLLVAAALFVLMLLVSTRTL
jgi:hypothetical protein